MGKRPPTHPPLSVTCEAGTRHPPWPTPWSIHVTIACGAKSSARRVIQRSGGLRSIMCTCRQPLATAARHIALYKGRNH